MTTALTNDTDVINITSAKLRADFTIVTPTMAADWLRLNHNNRNMRGRSVNMYARDMEAGDWITTGQAVQFDRDGVMIDGQHRLMAIIKADKPVMLLIVRGLDPAAKSVIDAGSKRSASDALKFSGVKNYTRVASLARLCLVLDSGGRGDTRWSGESFSNTEVDRYRSEHPEVETAVSSTQAIVGKLPLPPTVTAYCWMRLAAVDEEACREFFSAMAEMSTDGRGDPRKTLLDKLRDHEAKKVRIGTGKQVQLVFRAWNYWRDGKPLTVLKESKSAEIPNPR